ncbi:MAG: ABC transporter permease subunit [Bacteroidota bacterium]
MNMTIKDLWQLEYAKWKQNSVINILMIMYIAIPPAVLLLAKEIRDLPNDFSAKSFFIFPTVWDWLGYVGSWCSFFFLGLVAIFMIVNEVSYKTFRQSIINGMTRRQYLLAKLVGITGISIFATLYYAFVAIVSGLIHTKSPSLSYVFDNSYAIFRYFLMTFAYMSIGLFVGLLIRRSGVAVLLYIIYLLGIEQGIKWGLHFRYFNNWTINFYPGNVIEDLCPLPLYRLPDAFVGMRKEVNFDILLPYWQAILASVIWLTIIWLLSYRMMMRKDL